jgi:hypothetical protein
MAAGSVVASQRRVQVWGGVRFDWMMVALSLWFLGGLYIDGWAHTHGRVDTSFFTPWHAVFYSGFLAVATALSLTILRNRAAGLSWRRAVPEGYQPSLVGALIFAFGGVGDLGWHMLFGIETSVEALFSPSHLTLALGIALVVTGPLRAAWSRREAGQQWTDLGPMIFSVLLFLGLLTFMTQFTHPITQPVAATRYFTPNSTVATLRIAGGMASIWVQTAILMGLGLYVMRRWSLPFGVWTLWLTVNIWGLAVVEDELRFVPIALVVGLVADLFIAYFKPSIERVLAWRVFAFGVPTLFYSLYFATLWATGGIWWSVHLWTGAIVLAGAVGLLISYLVVPPASQT